MDNFGWLEGVSDEGKSVMLAALEEFIVVCEDYLPFELNDDDTLGDLLELRDKLEGEQ